jgi:hypothetical protein
MSNALALIPALTHVDDRLQAALTEVGVPILPFFRCSDLGKARSQLLTRGLEESGVDVFLLIDSDIVPTADQIRRLLGSPRLTGHEAVTGAYALRDGRTAFLPVDLDTPVMLGAPGHRELSYAGLGFAAIRREALTDIARELPRVGAPGGAWVPFCVPDLLWGEGETAEYLPDDYVLWHHHREQGGTLWLDQELLVAHVIAEPRRPLPGPVTRG